MSILRAPCDVLYAARLRRFKNPDRSLCLFLYYAARIFPSVHNISLGARAPSPQTRRQAWKSFGQRLFALRAHCGAEGARAPSKMLTRFGTVIYGVFHFLFARAKPGAAVWPIAWLRAQRAFTRVGFNVSNCVGEVFCIAI